MILHNISWLHNVELVIDSWYTVLPLITFVNKRELTPLSVNYY
jgi:hypothetical protein